MSVYSEKRMSEIEELANAAKVYGCFTMNTSGRPLYANELEVMNQFLHLRMWVRRWRAHAGKGNFVPTTELDAALRGEEPPE